MRRTLRHAAPIALAILAASLLWMLSLRGPIPSSPIDLTHTQITRQLSAEVAHPPPSGLRAGNDIPKPLLQTANGPQREVFGFVQANVVGDPSVGYPTWDFSMLTTVAYFGEHVNWDGNIVQSDTGWGVWNSSTGSNLVNYAHSRGVKVVLTLIMIDGSGNQNQMCSALGWGPSRTIPQGIAQMQALGADGINVDYEGENVTCSANGQTSQSMLISFMQQFHAAMPQGSYLSMDTYSGSGQGPDGFFNLPALAPSVDSFFIMAYDMEYYNWYGPPANCSSMCLGPTAPLTTYNLNDTRSAAEYTSTVPASKVILGVPYYGRKACVGPGNANAYPTSPIVADTYLDAAAEQTYSDTVPSTYSIHRDPYDVAGQERFDDWLSTTYNCTRQLYWDDFVSLGAKYDLVNRYNLRGVGIFTLNYGGGAPELWCDLRDHFSPGYVPATVTVPSTQSTTQFTVTYAAGQGCGVSAFDLQQQDVSVGQWADVAVNAPPASYVNQAYSGTFTANGYRGHTYQFRVRTHDGRGNVGAWSPYAATTVATNASLSHPFQGMYTLDIYGGIGADATAPAAMSAYWPNWNIARSAHALPGPNAPQGGLVLDGFGGLHPYGQGISQLNSPAYWSGWDIARDFAFLPDGSGGYILDGYGGLHGFSVNGGFGSDARIQGLGGGLPPPTQGAAYWPGWDIARKVVILPNGTGGYVLDGFGGIHAFGIGRAAPANPIVSGYWPNWDIAHDFALIPGTESGYVMDGYGGVHQFAPAGQPMPAAITGGAYWSGWDIARGIWFVPGATISQPQGYLLDGYGGLHPLGSVPGVSPSPYWGMPVGRCIWGG